MYMKTQNHFSTKVLPFLKRLSKITMATGFSFLEKESNQYYFFLIPVWHDGRWTMDIVNDETFHLQQKRRRIVFLNQVKLEMR